MNKACTLCSQQKQYVKAWWVEAWQIMTFSERGSLGVRKIISFDDKNCRRRQANYDFVLSVGCSGHPLATNKNV